MFKANSSIRDQTWKQPVLRSCQGIRLRPHRCRVEPASQPSASPPALSMPQRRASFLHLPAVLLQGSQHLAITGRHRWATDNTHGHRSSRPPRRPLRSTSTLLQTHLPTTEPRSHTLWARTLAQGLPSGHQLQGYRALPLPVWLQPPRAPPAKPGFLLQKAHVPSALSLSPHQGTSNPSKVREIPAPQQASLSVPRAT